MHLEIWQYIVAFVISVIAGWVDSIAGGGGLISLPTLIAIGLPPHLALGTNKLQSSFGSFSATLHHIRKGTIKWRQVMKGFFITAIFAMLGAFLAQSLSAKILNYIIPIALIGVALFMAFNPNFEKKQSKKPKRDILIIAILGSLLGFYDGFFGPGTGSFWAISLVAFLAMDLTKATGYTKAMNFASNIASLLLFFLGGNVIIYIGLIMGAGQFIGARIGSEMAIKNGAKLIKPLIIIVSAALAIKILISAL